MSYRTFFTVRHRAMRYAGDPGVEVDARVTYQDISDKLTVAQVDARIDGIKLTEKVVRELFPEALQAARDYQSMKLRASSDGAVSGPYKIRTDEPPTDAELVAMYVAGLK